MQLPKSDYAFGESDLRSRAVALSKHQCARPVPGGNGIQSGAVGIDPGLVWPYSSSMATITVKSTYSLDVETVRQLEVLARRWNTSKSGALRRAIQSAANQVLSDHNETLDALDRLQSMLALDRESAQAWADEVKHERRAASERRTPRTSQ